MIRGHKNFVHLYLSEGDGFVKIGITSNVVQRMKHAQSDPAGKTKLVQSWYIGPLASRVEQACKEMLKDKRHYGLERFSISIAEALAVIDEAMKRVERGEYTRSSYKSRQQRQRENAENLEHLLRTGFPHPRLVEFMHKRMRTKR